MSVVMIVTFAEDGTKTRIERISYDYNTDGIRVLSRHEIDADADGNFETRKETKYLNDPLNITGYSQVLKQTETDLETHEQTNITYIIGRNKIAQITVKNGTEQEFYFTFDGHGSTRVLTDLTGAILELYAYDAYGNAIGFDPSVALTEFLYSGEQFDSKIGQQYLRQQYYDPATGRFNRLDPFFGNLNAPQSLHKYLYTHADPVNMVDPNGLFGGVVGIGIGMAIGVNMRGMNIGAVGGAYNLFTNIILPILQLPNAVIQAYQEITNALNQLPKLLEEHFSHYTINAIGWQTRIKKTISKNIDIVLSHGLRPEYSYNPDQEPISTWGLNGAIAVSFTLKIPGLLKIIPIVGKNIEQFNSTLGKNGSILPIFNYTFTFLKGDVNTGTTNFWDSIKVLEGATRFAMRGSLKLGSTTYFAEFGASTKHGTESFSTAVYQIFSELGVTGRIVRDTVTQNLTETQSLVNRWTMFQFKWGGSGDGSDSG
jgi:RHS repeat-associated protein